MILVTRTQIVMGAVAGAVVIGSLGAAVGHLSAAGGSNKPSSVGVSTSGPQTAPTTAGPSPTPNFRSQSAWKACNKWDSAHLDAMTNPDLDAILYKESLALSDAQLAAQDAPSDALCADLVTNMQQVQRAQQARATDVENTANEQIAKICQQLQAR